jgi:hypothetical protein
LSPNLTANEMHVHLMDFIIMAMGNPLSSVAGHLLSSEIVSVDSSAK